MKILWESKESGWKNVDHAFQHIVSLSLLSLSYSCCKNVFPQNLQISNGNEDIVGIHRMGLEERMFVDHAFLHIVVCLHLLSQTFSDYKKHGAKLQIQIEKSNNC
jgi:hypothetical protein